MDPRIKSAGCARSARLACFDVLVRCLATADPDVRFPFFADLVVLAGGLYPIPSRTRPLNSPAPMVLSLKAWKSRSLPGLPKTEIESPRHDDRTHKCPPAMAGICISGIGDAADLDVERAVPGHHANEASRRRVARKIARVHRVDRGEMGGVGAIHVALDHLVERRPRR